jgi:hypothetical protein
MHQTLLDAHGAARFALDSIHAGDGPTDPFEMLDAWFVPWAYWKGPSTMRGGVVLIDERKTSAGHRWDAAHELGHIFAGHCGLDPRSETIANIIAASILMPDGPWKRDLDASEWDLEALIQLYGVSFEVAARRASEVRGAVCSAWEGERLVARWRSPWLHARGYSSKRVPAWEREIAMDCQRDVCHLREGEARAWWAPHRVFVVTPVEVWESLLIAQSPQSRAQLRSRECAAPRQDRCGRRGSTHARPECSRPSVHRCR